MKSRNKNRVPVILVEMEDDTANALNGLLIAVLSSDLLPADVKNIHRLINRVGDAVGRAYHAKTIH